MEQHQLIERKLTYISLFSSAGVGCYGFKLAGFNCIATNELLPARLAVQKANNKCKYDTGYILGDITSKIVQNRLFEEIKFWQEAEGLDQVDVVFATPPCQGMSSVNYKKTDHEQIRNSLVVEAIKIIKEIHPKVFVFENVRAFMKSICTDINGEDVTIEESINKNLSEDYNIHYNILNFKDFGVPSSRPRTIVIGTSKKITNVSPLLLFPTRRHEITLREAIGSFPSLKFGEKDETDPLHFARKFPKHQIEWIADLREGQSAFDKPKDKQPYKIDKDGNRVILKGDYMGNKYRRLFWDKPGACIATRNDVLSSQDTIHPSDNRVLSIRELMRLMTIPDSFCWTNVDHFLTVDSSSDYLKKHEMNIRHCIGEAVPTHIIFEIASKIKNLFVNTRLKQSKECELSQVKVFEEIVNKMVFKDKVNIRILDINAFKLFSRSISNFYNLSEKVTFVVDNVDLTKKSFGDIPSNVTFEKFPVTNISLDYEVSKNTINTINPYKQLSLFDFE